MLCRDSIDYWGSRKSFQHPRDCLIDHPLHPVLIFDNAFQAVLCPTSPDHPVGSRIDNVQHQSPTLVLHNPDTAVFAVAVAILPVHAIDVESPRDARVMVNQQIGLPC